jgi:hypothetical protein
MFLIRSSTCDLSQSWTRRDCLQIGMAGALGIVGNTIPRTQHLHAAGSRATTSFGRAKSCIFIYLFGGPSHIDIWDMKPGAPPEIRGEFKPQPTNVPGIQITDHLPRLAQHAKQYAIIRSLSHGDSAHGSAGHAMLTGRQPKVRGEVGPTSDDFPHYGR